MLARRVARALEEGSFAGFPFAASASRVYGRVAARSLARPMRVPHGVAVVAVGGATLGGSSKTPLAIACVRALAKLGHDVALVGHAYGASPRIARVVDGGDALELVGDEALVCARALVDVPRARVVVAPERRGAAELAMATGAKILVLDGVAQIAPFRATVALLAVDAREPWGRECATPPRGDLRAPIAALLDVCDVMVKVGDGLDAGPAPSPRGAALSESFATASSDGARWLGPGHEAQPFLDWDALRKLRVGVFTALARPSRVVDALRRRGIDPVATLTFADHHPPRALPRPPSGARVDVWIGSAKCAIRMPPSSRQSSTADVAEIDYRVELAEALDAYIRARCASALTP